MHPAKPEKYMYEPILTRTFLSWCVHTRGVQNSGGFKSNRPTERTGCLTSTVQTPQQ